MEFVHFVLVVLGLLVLCWPAVRPFPNGAPTSVCGSMMPRHTDISPQTSASPHSIYVKNSGNSVQVKIMGPGYKGILLEARTPNGTTTVGMWADPPNNTKTISCFNMEKSAITHSNTNDKNNHTAYTWNSESCTKEVAFLATVANNRDVYWLNVSSEVIYSNCSGCSVKTMSGFSVLALLMSWSLTG